MSEYIKRHLRMISIIVIVIIFAIIPQVTQNPYTLGLLIMIGINAVLAMTFILVLRTGMVSLAIAGFWGLGAYFSAILSRELAWSFWACLPAATIITGLIGLILGIALVRNPGFTFTIITMVINMLFVVIVGSTSWLGGYSGLRDIPPPDPINLPFLSPITFVSISASYYLLMFLFVIVIVVLAILYRRWTGRAWTIIGLNSRLAESSGINVFRYRLIAFVIGCAIAGLMGSFFAHYLGVLKPETFTLFKTVYVHIYALLGGINYAFMGPVVGSFIMLLFPEFFRFAKEFQQIISGALVIVIVVLLPSGILSLPVLRDLIASPGKTLAGIPRNVRYAFSSRQRGKEA